MENGLIETTLLENLRLSNSPKKDAISRAIPILKHEWVVTTDADCTVNKNWLLTLDNFIQKNTAEMVVGAVVYKTKNNIRVIKACVLVVCVFHRQVVYL